jgi:hypothetical protein
MSENDPQLDPPLADPVPDPPEDSDVRETDAKSDAAQVNAGGKMFAVYDRDELRYRGRGPFTTRKDADALKAELSKPKGVRRGRFDVREV